MKNGVVYKIQNIDNGKTYVGCTRNFGQRISCHLTRAFVGDTSFLFYPELRESPEKFVFQILESDVPLFDLKVKESRWISELCTVQDGYNQCVVSGNEILTEPEVNDIKMMLEMEIVKFSDIATMFGVDPCAISDINRGKSWHDPSRIYPLRKNTVVRKKLSVDDLQRIHDMLADETFSFVDIAKEFGWESQAVVRKINAGTYSIRLYPLDAYPIRSVDSRKGSRKR